MEARGPGAALLVVLLLVQAVPTASAAGDLAGPAEQALVDLKLEALAGHRTDEDPLERLRQQVLPASRVPTQRIEAAWSQAANASGPSARETLLAAEAELFALARTNALAAEGSGDDAAARAWLEVVLARVDWRGRSIPAGELLGDGSLDREPLVEVLDSVTAVRAREAIWKAFLLNASDRRPAAEATAEGAKRLAQVLVPNATDRLPSGLAAGFRGNLTQLPSLVLSAGADQSRHLFPSLMAPLTALEFGHDVEPLEVFAQRPIDGAYLAVRAMREDPRIAPALADAAFRRYNVDRTPIGFLGEGPIERSDEAYRALRSAIEASDRAAARQAADQVAARIGEVALLGHGVVLEIETGGVRQNSTHTYDVTLIRPSLEGVASYELSLTYEGDIVAVPGAQPLRLADGFQLEGGGSSGDVTLTGEASPPLRSSAKIALLEIHGTGPQGAETNLTVQQARFLEPDGDELPRFIVRDGHVTITVHAGEEAGPDAAGTNRTDARGTPLGPIAALLGLGLAARRRLRP